mgnify:CR=1 FL=1
MDNNTNNWKEFTLGDVQEEQPRRVAKRSRKPLLVLLIVAVLAGAAGAGRGGEVREKRGSPAREGSPLFVPFTGIPFTEQVKST